MPVENVLWQSFVWGTFKRLQKVVMFEEIVTSDNPLIAALCWCYETASPEFDLKTWFLQIERPRSGCLTVLTVLLSKIFLFSHSIEVQNTAVRFLWKPFTWNKLLNSDILAYLKWIRNSICHAHDWGGKHTAKNTAIAFMRIKLARYCLRSSLWRTWCRVTLREAKGGLSPIKLPIGPRPF